DRLKGSRAGTRPGEAMAEITGRMTRFGAHLRSAGGAAAAFEAALGQLKRLEGRGLKVESAQEVIAAFHVRQQCLTHAAMLFAVREMLARGAGSRGSHCVLDQAGTEMHPGLTDPAGGRPYRFKAENESLRDHILAVRYNADLEERFECRDEKPRPIPSRDAAFETAWREFREGRIYDV
ncbi:MAG: hypothetical protein AMJ81_08970, partial [Phycisphaerae bacterium SM23_33]